MKKSFRLLKNTDFTLVIHGGKSLKSDSFIVYYLKNSLGNARVGVSVSKKRGNAVTRNRIRRQTRAMCDNLIDYSTTSFDIIVVVKDNFKENNYQENQQILKNLLEKFVGNKNEEKN